MKKTQHTPGHWKYDGDGFDSVAAAAFGTDGYTVMTQDCTPICEVDQQPDDAETEANARLIAAAPKLLDALLTAQKAVAQIWLQDAFVDYDLAELAKLKIADALAEAGAS